MGKDALLVTPWAVLEKFSLPSKELCIFFDGQ